MDPLISESGPGGADVAQFYCVGALCHRPEDRTWGLNFWNARWHLVRGVQVVEKCLRTDYRTSGLSVNELRTY